MQGYMPVYAWCRLPLYQVATGPLTIVVASTAVASSNWSYNGVIILLSSLCFVSYVLYASIVRRFHGGLLVTPPCRTLWFVRRLGLVLPLLPFVLIKHHITGVVVYDLHSLQPVSLCILL